MFDIGGTKNVSGDITINANTTRVGSYPAEIIAKYESFAKLWP